MSDILTLTVRIDRAEALRRGHGTTGATTTLTVPTAELDEDARRAIASRLAPDGTVVSRYLPSGSPEPAYQCTGHTVRWTLTDGPTWLPVTIPEPSIAGVLEAIAAEEAAILTEIAEREAQATAQAEQRRQETQAVLDARRTRERRVGCRETARGDLEVSLAAGWLSDEHYHVADWPYHSDAEVRASPEAVAWEAELAEAQKAAEARALAAYRAHLDAEAAAKAEREATRAAGREVLREWARQHGSDLLRARLAHEDDGIAWTALARDEWVDSTLRRAGLSEDALSEEPEGYEYSDSQSAIAPSLDEIQALAYARAQLDGRDVDAEVKLLRMEYVQADPARDYSDDDSDDGLYRVELRVTVVTPDGKRLTRDYLPAEVLRHAPSSL